MAALLIFDDLRSEGNGSLFKTENIINLLKDLDVHDVIDLQLLTLLRVLIIVSQKNSFQVEVNEFEKKHPRKVHAVLTQYNRISFVLEACKFVKTFISLSLMSPFTPEAYTADTI